LTGTAGGIAQAAAIYLPATVTPTAPVTLGGVTSTITGATVSVQTQAGATTPPAPISFPVTVDTVAPYLTTHYIICVSGIFPPFS
jgi:microcystin-dependent protein